METYKGFRAIYPPAQGCICKACSSCGGDVKLDKGFIDEAEVTKPFTGYVCASCTTTAIGGNRASELLQFAQEKYRKSLA